MLRKMLIGAFLVAAGSCAAFGQTFATETWTDGRGNPFTVAARELLVKFRRGVSPARIAAIHAEAGLSQAEYLSDLDVYRMSLGGGDNLTEKIKMYGAHREVAFAEPNFVYRAFFVPNDADYGSQWGLGKIDVERAWDVTRGASAVMLGFLDTGIDATHPEFGARVVAGYDFVNDDATASDDNGHGTGVAGIAAAQGNNGAGIAGVDWNCRILPVKVLDSAGFGTAVWAAKGLAFAQANGCRAVTMAFGGPGESQTLKIAVSQAVAQGLFIVGAAGDAGAAEPVFPAAYGGVFAVAGTTSGGAKASFSNEGAWLDLAAPGEGVLATAMGGGYGTVSGTSAAAAFVAGTAGLLYARDAGASVARVARAMKETATDLGAPGRDDTFGYGLLDAGAAVSSFGGSPRRARGR